MYVCMLYLCFRMFLYEQERKCAYNIYAFDCLRIYTYAYTVYTCIHVYTYMRVYIYTHFI